MSTVPLTWHWPYSSYAVMAVLLSPLDRRLWRSSLSQLLLHPLGIDQCILLLHDGGHASLASRRMQHSQLNLWCSPLSCHLLSPLGIDDSTLVSYGSGGAPLALW